MRKIWWIRAMLIVFLALFIAGSVLAGELKNIIKKFTCNNIEITVLSQVSDEGDIQLKGRHRCGPLYTLLIVVLLHYGRYTP